MKAAAFSRLSSRGRMLAAALAGGVMALAQPPLGFWPAFFLAGPALYLLWGAAARASRPGRAAFAVGWAAGAAHFALALHWIVEPFLVDVARYGWMAPFALVGLSGGLALFWGAGFWLAGRCGRMICGPFALALFWAGGEFLRSWALTGFPWALPVYGWMETPLAQAAALTGPYGLSFLTLAAMLAPGALFERPRAILPAAVALPALAGLWIWGAARVPALQADESQPLIRIVQTDVNQADKWAIEQVKPGFEKLLALSSGPAAERPAVIVWPESAVTFPLDQAPGALTTIRERIGESALAVGSLRVDRKPGEPAPPDARWRNSLFLFEKGELAPPFDKVHLVPFGEYMPLSALMSRFGIDGIAGRGAGIVAGETHVLMSPAGAPPFAPLICYEMIFPHETARAAEGAGWLVLVTNDGWFGDWAGPAQHFAMARMRAIETGLPVARSANSGRSAMIDPYGREIGALSAGREGVIDARLPNSLVTTSYLRHNELLTTLTICIALAFSFMACRRNP